MRKTWFMWDVGLQKLAAWLQTKHIYGHVKPLFGEQNCSVLTSMSSTLAAMATRSRTRLQCKPQIFGRHMASQKKYLLRVKENKDQNLKKSCAIRHAVWQTCAMMNTSKTQLSLKYC
jgi:hypothetical protein